MSDVSATAFEGARKVAAGPLAQVWRTVRPLLDASFPVLVFDDATGRQIDPDLRAPLAEPEAPKARGRPKLGVTAREVTLLPRHWDWLARQQGGASVALRKIVEDAMRSPQAKRRQAQEAAYRFSNVVAGDLPGYEEAIRALFASDEGRFNQHIQAWPADVRDHARTLAAPAFTSA